MIFAASVRLSCSRALVSLCTTLKMIDPGENQACQGRRGEDDLMNEARSTVDQAVGAIPLVDGMGYFHQLAKLI